MNLHSKILLILIPLIVLPLLGLGWLSLQQLQQTAQQTLLDQMETLVHQVDQSVQTRIQTAKANIDLFSESSLLKTYIRIESEQERYELFQLPLLKLFASYHHAYPEYYEIRFLLTDGYEDTRYVVPGIPNVREEEEQTDYFQRLQSATEPIQTFFIQNPDNQQPILLVGKKLITYTTPTGLTSTNPILRGYLMLTVDLSFLENHVQTNTIGKQGEIFFTDAQGTILFHRNPEKMFEKLPEALLPLLHADAHASQEFKALYQGQPHLFQKKHLHSDLFLFATLSEKEFLLESQVLKKQVLWITVGTILMTLICIFLTLHFLIIRPLRQLGNTAEKLGQGHLDERIHLPTHDEIGFLAKGFNTMAQGIQNLQIQKAEAQAEALTNLELRLKETEKLVAMTETFEKFVPRQFLDRIAQKGLSEIELGKAEIETISILFSDIRAFTTLSEKMTPQEILNFLNSYFQRMNETIRTYHGFVDKFIGDAIMALFDGSHSEVINVSQDTLTAAIGMQKAVTLYNQHRQKTGYRPIEIGIGVHSGPVVIGTVGSLDRMDSTVLGDTVNVASRLEGLTKYYKSHIIASAHTLKLLPPEFEFQNRELGMVHVKGRTKPIRIYEIFDTDPEPLLEQKLKLLPQYQQGLKHYYCRQWKEAILCFQQCLKVCPNDVVSRLYLQSSQKYQKNPPSNWSETLDDLSLSEYSENP